MFRVQASFVKVVSFLVWRDLPNALLLILEEMRPRVECSLGWQGGGRLALRSNGKGSTISTLDWD